MWPEDRNLHVKPRLRDRVLKAWNKRFIGCPTPPITTAQCCGASSPVTIWRRASGRLRRIACRPTKPGWPASAGSRGPIARSRPGDRCPGPSRAPTPASGNLDLPRQIREPVIQCAGMRVGGGDGDATGVLLFINRTASLASTWRIHALRSRKRPVVVQAVRLLPSTNP